jgi:hypothetical protein
MNRKVAAGSINYLAAPGVSVNTLRLMTTNSGSQRLYGWLEGSPSFRSELEFSVIPVPISSTTNVASIFGTHGITGYGIMASNLAWGLSWQRGLSPGGIVQWSEIEPTEGNFTFTSTDAKVASCADKAIIFANLTDVADIPSWAMTNGVPRLDRLSNYVFQTVTHFKNQIHYWEDINEPSTEAYTLIWPSKEKLSIESSTYITPPIKQIKKKEKTSTYGSTELLMKQKIKINTQSSWETSMKSQTSN